MENGKGSVKSGVWLWVIVVTMFVVAPLCPSQTQAQVPARFYWKTLSGTNAVPLIVKSVNGNTNPFDPAHNVSQDAEVDATVSMMGFAKFLPLFDRAAMAAVVLPMGRISSDVTAAGRTSSQSINGFGDPILELSVNIIGPPAQMTIPDALRYEPSFSVDLLTDLALPIGEYDDNQNLNIGQNRWYGRVGAPIIWQLGSWVPGRRTTVELLPSLWWFGDNDDYVGQRMETDPMFQLDGHLTRDLNEHLWVSLDGCWSYGGEATINGVSGDKLNSIALGPTLGYQLNENLTFTVSYKSTIDDDDSDDLRMDIFMVSFVYGWHDIIEGSRRLKEG